MNNIPNIDLVREMYDRGWITIDLYINGGTSLDLLLMYQHGIDIIQQNPIIDFDVHCYNNITVSSQIEAYTDLICETEYFVDYFTEPILERYKEQLQILKTLNVILQTKLN
tara:strand:- start:16 stop:348 length:333 start_codon:yes stop_codon:yes gene_type:complete